MTVKHKGTMADLANSERNKGLVARRERRKRNSKNPTIWDLPNLKSQLYSMEQELRNLERELGIGAK